MFILPRRRPPAGTSLSCFPRRRHFEFVFQPRVLYTVVHKTLQSTWQYGARPGAGPGGRSRRGRAAVTVGGRGGSGYDHWPAPAGPGRGGGRGPPAAGAGGGPPGPGLGLGLGYQRIQLNEGGRGGTARIMRGPARALARDSESDSESESDAAAAAAAARAAAAAATVTPATGSLPPRPPGPNSDVTDTVTRADSTDSAAWGAGAGYDCADFDPGKQTIL